MAKSEKLPAMHFYPGDWKKDLGVQALDFHDRHVWFELLLLMHDSEQRGVLLINGKPPTDDALARIVGLDKQNLTKALTNIKANGCCGIRDDGAIFSRRMVRDEDIRQKRIKAGSMGGNPNLLNQNPSKPEANVKQIPEDENEDENEDNKKENCIDDPDGLLALSESKLEKPNNQDWTFRSLFTNTGRRPLKNYPSLHLTPNELAYVLRDWRASGIPDDEFESGFVFAESRAKTIIASGKPPPDAQSWLLGFVKNSRLETLEKQERLARQKSYSAKGETKHPITSRPTHGLKMVEVA